MNVNTDFEKLFKMARLKAENKLQLNGTASFNILHLEKSLGITNDLTTFNRRFA